LLVSIGVLSLSHASPFIRVPVKTPSAPLPPNFCFPFSHIPSSFLPAHTTKTPTSGVHILNLLWKPTLSTRPSPLFPGTSCLPSDLIFPHFSPMQAGLFPPDSFPSPQHTHTQTPHLFPSASAFSTCSLQMFSTKNIPFFSICKTRGPLFLFIYFPFHFLEGRGGHEMEGFLHSAHPFLLFPDNSQL